MMSGQRSMTTGIISHKKHKTYRRTNEEILGGSESMAAVSRDYRICPNNRHGAYLFEGSVFTKGRTNLVTRFLDPICLISRT